MICNKIIMFDDKGVEIKEDVEIIDSEYGKIFRYYGSTKDGFCMYYSKDENLDYIIKKIKIHMKWYGIK